jgi:hypothetical protein
MHWAVLDTLRGLISLYVLAALIVDVDKVSRATRSLFRFGRPEVLPLPPTPCVNYIAGVVLPAPHDPRWKLGSEEGSTVEAGRPRLFYDFGPNLRVYSFGVRVMAENGCSVCYIAEGPDVPLFAAIKQAQKEFDQMLAADRLIGTAVGPALTNDEWKRLEQRFPDPDVPRRIGPQ